MSEYEIKSKRELLNSSLHILGGALVSYILVPVYSVWIMIFANLMFGGLREFLQYKRGKIQPWWIMTIDTFGWVVGGLLWYWARNYFQINADIL